MENIIIITVLSIIISLSVFYIVRAKKRGTKCIGCPHGGKCSGSCKSKK